MNGIDYIDESSTAIVVLSRFRNLDDWTELELNMGQVVNQKGPDIFFVGLGPVPCTWGITGSIDSWT